MKLNPYLSFDGNGMEAANYYAELLGGEVTMAMTYGEMPDQGDWVTEDMKRRLAHATVRFGENSILLSDTPGREPHQGYHGVTLQISVGSFDEGQTMFDKIAKDGDVRMPYGPQFWTKGFGMLHDKYGVAWMVNCE